MNSAVFIWSSCALLLYSLVKCIFSVSVSRIRLMSSTLCVSLRTSPIPGSICFSDSDSENSVAGDVDGVIDLEFVFLAFLSLVF